MTFPRDWKEFRKWREKQTFANSELTNLAEIVENIMRVLAQLDEVGAEMPAFRSGAEITINEFERKLQG